MRLPVLFCAAIRRPLHFRNLCLPARGQKIRSVSSPNLRRSPKAHGISEDTWPVASL